MQYLLDTANVEEIRKTYESYPIDRVTTNPTICIIGIQYADCYELHEKLAARIGGSSIH